MTSLFKSILSVFGQESKKNQSSDMVGIDIGSSSIKVVQLNVLDDGSVSLKTYGELQLGPYFEKSIGEAVPFNLEKHTTALTDLLRESGVTSKNAVLSMPLWSSFVSVFPVTLQKNEQIESKIPVLARKYVPISSRNVTLDWVVLNEEEDTLQKDIFLVAMQKDSVASFNGLMQNVGFRDYLSELEVFSAVRALSQGDGEDVEVEIRVVIDVGASLSKLYIIRNGLIEKFHRVATGGIAMTKSLALKENITFEEAEERKRSRDLPDEMVRTLISSTLTSPFQEFKRVINKYELAKSVKIEEVSIAGGVAAFSQLALFASDILERNVKNAQPFDAVSSPPFMEDVLNQIGPVFTNSIGASERI